jgi:hypothetical protein
MEYDKQTGEVPRWMSGERPFLKGQEGDGYDDGKAVQFIGN